MSIFVGENFIYTFVSNRMKQAVPDLVTVSTPPDSAERFPCVSISEIDSYSDVLTQTADSTENLTTVIYEINVYSNLQSGRKEEAKKLAALADDLMCNKKTGLGFRRTSQIRTPNISDNSVYRITCRYWGKIERNGVVYSM